MKYRKKPIVIEAYQWNGFLMLADSPTVEPFKGETEPARACEHCKVQMRDHGWIHTIEGGHIVCPGDWIITGINQERYPCKNDVFRATYEPVME